MATRTIKFLGKAYAESGDVTFNVTFNGNEVHNGVVTTKPFPENTEGLPFGPEHTDELYEMFTFNVDTSVTGWIPLQVSVSGGIGYFGLLHGNYTGFETNVDSLDPNTNTVNDLEFTVAPDSYYRDLNNNSLESDGKRSVVITPDAHSQTRTGSEEFIGDWHYRIEDGATLTCEYYIDPDLDTSSLTIEDVRAAAE
jgi:hypothetical protein